MMNVPCPNCGSRSATAKVLPEYRYRESGLSNIRLKGGVTETTCPRCKKKHVRIEKEAQLLQVVALGLLMRPGFLTGPEMRFLRGSCQMSQAALAIAIKHRRETVSERESKPRPDLSLAEELLLRLVLLQSFRTYVGVAENDFLSPDHHERLDRFTIDFCTEALPLAEKSVRKIELTAAMDKNGRRWQLDQAA